MQHLKQAISYVLLIAPISAILLVHFWLDTCNGEQVVIPLVCPTTYCECPSNVLYGLDVVNFQCHFNGTTAKFKFNPRESMLHPLNKDALNPHLLQSLSGLQSLNLSGLEVTELADDLFDHLDNLQMVFLTDNNLTHLSPSLWRNKSTVWAIHADNNQLESLGLESLPPTSLKRIIANGNRLQLWDEMFSNFTKLEWLHLGRNRITQLPPRLLHNLKVLQELDLRSNAITEIPENFFSQSLYLRELYLANNLLTRLPNTFSVGLLDLRELHLDNNQLESITNDVFQQLAKLVFLTLSNNRIGTIEPHAFEPTKNLEKLDLSYNRLDFRTDVPVVKGSLRLLNLSHNNIAALDSKTWQQYPCLGDLDLSYNSLEYLQISWLNFIYSCNKNKSTLYYYNKYKNRTATHTEINLQHNKIAVIDVQHAADLNGTNLSFMPTTLLINHNPINCDCESRPLVTFLLSQHQDQYPVRLVDDQLLCDKPVSLKTEKVSEVLKVVSHCDKQCPSECQCFNQNLLLGFTVLCKGQNLVEIPPNHYHNVTVLNMNYNPIDNATGIREWNSLLSLHLKGALLAQHMKNLTCHLLPLDDLKVLQKLDISSNNLERLEEMLFHGLSELVELDISYNRLTVLSNNTFSNLTNLMNLFLHHNRLKVLTEGLFEKSNKLVVLQLGFNNLTTIGSVLSGTCHLRELYLEQNELNLTANDSVCFESSEVIVLAHNRISSLSSLIAHNIPKLKKLDLSFNSVSIFNTSDFHLFKDGVITNLEHNNISRFLYNSSDVARMQQNRSNPILINLNSNPARCRCGMHDFIENLKNRSISNDAPKMEFLVDNLSCSRPRRLEGRKVQTLATHEVRCKVKEDCPSNCKCYKSFSDQLLECPEIPDLVHFNTHYLKLTREKFESLKKLNGAHWANLTKLKLRHVQGNAADLQSGIFQNLRNLTELAFVQSPLIHTDRKWFQNLPLLTKLDLNGDQINVLSSDTFLGTDNIVKLNLTNNSISALPDTLLHGFNSLEILDLSYNQIQSITTAFMQTGQHLQELYLNNNYITSIEYDTLTISKGLIELDLSWNILGVSEVENLPHSIQTLSLSGNSISKIAEQWFNLGNLKSIDLSFTRLQTVKMDDLINFPLECTVYLRNTSLTQIEWFSNSTLERLNTSSSIKTTIVLDNNSIHCNCYVEPLANFLRISASNFRLPITIQAKSLLCSTPKILEGMLVSSVEPQDLFCPLENCPESCQCYLMAAGHKKVLKCINSNIDVAHLNYINPVQVLNIDSSIIANPSELLTAPWDSLTALTFRNVSTTWKNMSLGELLWNKTELEHLDVSCNGLNLIPQNAFSNAHKLRSLILHSNNLEMILKSIFDNLLRLQLLDLSFNNLATLSKETFLKLSNLRQLNLAHNNISFFSQDFLPLDVPLNILNLSYNNFQMLNSNFSFSQLTKLQVLDWSNNHIKVHENLPLILPLSLTTLNISRNNLTLVYFQNWTEFNNLKILNMSDNAIQYLNLMDLLFANNSDVTVHLDGNTGLSKYSSSPTEQSVHNVKYWKQHLTLTIDHTNLSCDCQFQSYDSTELQNYNISIFVTVKLKEPCINQNKDPFCIIAESCAVGCVCYKLTTTNTVVMNCTGGNWTQLPTVSPHSVHKLVVDNHHIVKLGGLRDERWRNLTHLSLRHNHLKILDHNLYPSRLQYVHLDNNHLMTPSGWLLDMIRKSASPTFNLTLGNNRWICECEPEIIYFQNWLIENTGKIPDTKDVTCSNNKEPLLKVQLCPLKWQLTIAVIAVVLIALTSSVIAAIVLYFQHKAAVHMWLYAHGFCISEDEVDKDKEYDAFISYSSDDTDYVFDSLVPKLEESAPFYKLCIHERDWHVGEQILDQIALSVEKSRRIIVVLSTNFVRSVWSGLEFQAAHHQSLKDRINRIIIVVLGELPPNDALEPDLRMHISMNTYLKSDDPQFMDKLRYAMPHKRAMSREKDALQLKEIRPPVAT